MWNAGDVAVHAASTLLGVAAHDSKPVENWKPYPHKPSSSREDPDSVEGTRIQQPDLGSKITPHSTINTPWSQF
jgi:hypothetical protein